MARRRLTTTLLALSLTAGTAAAAVAAGALDAGAQQGRPIALSGQVEGLTPGAARDLVVRIANPNDAPLAVASVTTDVSSPEPGCPASALRVGSLRAAVTVPAGGAADGVVPVTLTADAPDACQGVRFALSFQATGRGEGALTPDGGGTTTTPAETTPTTPTTPAQTTPTTPVTPSAHGTRTKIVRKRVCKRRRVKVRRHGRTVRRWKRVCKIVKVKVRVPA